jgi:hypothetical protein
MYCPTGTALYKDTADGKFYCYSPNDLAAAVGPVAGQPKYNDPLGGNVGAPTSNILVGAPLPALDQLSLAAALQATFSPTQALPVNLGSSLDVPPPAPPAMPDYIVPADTTPVSIIPDPGVLYV